MATTFTGLRVQDTYNAILKIGNNSNLSGTAKILSDGVGNSSSIYLSTTRFGIGITPAYQFHTSGNAKIGGDVIISGDLTVNGDLTYLNVTDLAVEDPLIKLAKDNTANTLDIGLFGKYVATGTKYKGFYNDASDDKFKLFIGTTVEPTTTVDTSASGYTIGTLVANIEGNVTGGTISGTAGTFSGNLTTNGTFTVNTNDTTLQILDAGTNALQIKVGAGDEIYFGSNNTYQIQCTTSGNVNTLGAWNYAGNITGTTATFTGLVTGIAPTSDLNFATKKYVDDQTTPTPTLSSVLGAGNTSGANDIIMADSQKVFLGTDSDLEIYHDGTDGYIDNTNGELIIQNNSNDKKIIFKSDNGIGDITEYFRIDGNINRNVITVTTQLNDNVPLIFGDGAGRPSIKYDSTAVQLFIGGQIKFLDDIYVLGKTNLNDVDIDDTLAFYVSSTDAARQRADARDDDTNYARLHWFGRDDAGQTSNFRHAYYDGANYINVTAASNILTYTGGATFNNNLDVIKNSTGDLMSRIYNSNTDGTGTSVVRIANAGNQANGARLEFSDSTYYNSSITADRTNGLRFFVHDDATSMTLLLAENVLTLANDKSATFYGSSVTVAPVSGDGILFLQSTSQTLRIDQNSIRTTTDSQITFMTHSFNALQLDTSQNSIFFGNLYMPQYLKHSGDENTYLQFQDDRVTLVAGGSEFIDFANTTQDYITIGGGSDIDVKLVSSTNNKFIFIQGSDGKIGINDLTPDYAFDVNAETRFGSAVNFDSTRYNKGGSSTFWYATTTNAKVNMDARVDGTGVVIHKWNRNADDSDYVSYAENWYDGNSYHKISAYNNGFMLNGNIRFESYGAGNITGTLSRLVGFEANGGLIDVPLSTFIDGSGVAGRIPYFTDSSSLTSSSLFFENSDKIRHLQTIGPSDNVRKGFCVEDQTAMAANVGGQLTFRYMYTSEGAITEGGMIRTYKENGNSGEYGSGLKFQVRNHGDDLSSKMTLNPSGFLGLGTTNPYGRLELSGSGNLWSTAPAIRMWDSLNSKGWLIGTANNYNAGDFYIRTLPSESGNPSASELEFTIKHATGYVGIGRSTGMTSLLNFAANQNAADAGSDNWSGSAINTFGGDIATGRIFFQGHQQTGNDTIGINIESSNRAVLYNYTDNRYLQIWNDNGNIEMPSGSLGIGVSPDTGNGGLQITKTAGTFANSNQKRVASFYDGSVNSEKPGIILGYDDSSTPHGIIAARTQSGTSTIPGLQFFTYNGSNWGAKMTILANGNTGIGTSSPLFGLSMAQGTGDVNRIGWNDSAGNKRASILCSSSTDALQFHTGTSDSVRMQITSGGYVLINRTSNATNQPLQVQGFIDITNVDASALRFYNGSTFRGGFGMSRWGVGANVVLNDSDMVSYAVGNLDFVTGGTSFASVRVNNNYNLIVTGGNHAFNGDSSYGGISINVPAVTKKYLAFFDSGTTTYGGGMWYDEASNITSLYSLLGGTQTQHVQLDRATGNTWINPSGGKVTIGVGSTQSEMLHIRSTSGDADILLHSSNNQKLRLDSNSIRTTTASNLAIFVNNDTAKGIFLNSAGYVMCGTTSNPTRNEKFYTFGEARFESSVGPDMSIRGGLAHYDTTTGNGAGIGGQLVLGYRYSNSSYTEGAIIKMYKVNSTNGNYSSGLKFQVRNSGEDLSAKMTLNSGGDLSVVGSMTAAGDVIAFSDKRVKTNIKTIDNGLEKISKLRGVSYNRTDIDDKSDKIGVIAQEVKEVLPEVVNYNKDDDRYGVDYGKMAGVFIEAIKELKAEVNSLKQEIKELKK